MSWLTMNEHAHGNHGPVIVKTDSGMIFPITSPKKGILQGHLSRLRIICYLLPRFPQLAACSSLTLDSERERHIGSPSQKRTICFVDRMQK